jgi:hypothetical protein
MWEDNIKIAFADIGYEGDGENRHKKVFNIRFWY